MRDLTEEQKVAILKRWDKGVPLKQIAYEFGTYESYVSLLAKRRGRAPRYERTSSLLVVKMRPEIKAALKRYARENRQKPETIAREAIAAYLGLDQ